MKIHSQIVVCLCALLFWQTIIRANGGTENKPIESNAIDQSRKIIGKFENRANIVVRSKLIPNSVVPTMSGQFAVPPELEIQYFEIKNEPTTIHFRFLGVLVLL